MSTHPLAASDLEQFTGSENWYQHGIMKRITFTDGVKYVADQGGAYWLIDEIALHQLQPEIKAQPFQVWKLTVDLEKCKGTLTCEDGDGNVVFTKELHYTDFPLAEIKFYFTDNVILLPSEY